MPIQVFGISHKTAPIDVRERLAIADSQLPQALQTLVHCSGVKEALILSTCNRTELYCELASNSDRQPFDWLVRFQKLDRDLVQSHSYSFHDRSAVRHILKVACGLDSMVLGEPQILGQLKQAYRAAISEGATGKTLHRLFQFSFSVAKKVRSETAIGENPVSVAFAAAKLASQIHGDLSSKTALLVGAGETISLVAKHLSANGIQEMLITNRTWSRAHDLASEVDASAIPYAELEDVLPQADILVSSTGSTQPIISYDMISAALHKRGGDPIFIVDLAVPRDVEARVAELDDVYLYSVDDLDKVVNENAKERKKAAAEAEVIIEENTQNYLKWLQSDDSAAAIVTIRDQADTLKRAAVKKAIRRLEAGDPPHEVLELLANNLTNKFLHRPIKTLTAAARSGDDDIIKIAQKLLGKENDNE